MFKKKGHKGPFVITAAPVTISYYDARSTPTCSEVTQPPEREESFRK